MHEAIPEMPPTFPSVQGLTQRNGEYQRQMPRGDCLGDLFGKCVRLRMPQGRGWQQGR
jgi:hypothetical protein